jgi:hypothetical protein
VAYTKTFTVVVAPEHPPCELPDTVYIILAVGVTLMPEPTNAPGFHVYDVAPAAFNITELPAQTDAELANAKSCGIAALLIITEK